MILTDEMAWQEAGFFEKPEETILSVIRRKAKTADAYVKSAVGDDIDETDPKAIELALMAFRFFYDGDQLMGTKGAAAQSAMFQSLKFQLQAEWRKSHET